MRTVHSLFAAAVLSLAVSLPATAGPVVSGKVPNATQATRSAAIKRTETGLNKSNELQMGQLQNSVSQRQAAIQTTTRIIQSTGNPLKNCPACFR